MSTEELLCVDVQKVREAVGKSENDVLEYIAMIKKWFKTQPHLPEIPSDNLIESFLVTNKFLVERTKEKLDLYYTIRTLIPECFKNKNPKLSNMRRIAKVVYYCPLPKLTKDLYRINVTKILGDPILFDTYDFFGHQMNINEIRLHEEIIMGDVLIMDFEEIKMGHVAKFSPMQMRKAAIILEKVFSNRIKGIHIVNAPSFVDIILSIVKPVLKQKLAERLIIHSKPESLCSYIPADILPKDYGGKEMSLKELDELWRKKLIKYQDRFDKLDKLRVKEGLRPSPLRNDEILGYHGNFRRLNVD